MSYRNLPYSLNRSNLVQSPPQDSGNQSDIKARLTYRSPPTKRPLMNHNFGGASSSPHYHSKSVGDYHMSRQNPDVLDKLYAPSSPAADTTDNNRMQPFPLQNVDAGGSGFAASSANQAVLGRLNGHHSTAVSPRLPGGVASPQMSYLRHMLDTRRSKSASPSSLVQMAAHGGVNVRRKGGRLLRSRLGGLGGGSPATVKLAGVSRSSGGGQEEGAGREQQQQQTVYQHPNGLNQQPINPCDKEVVLSALRQRRKRWATPGLEDSFSTLPDSISATSPPTAKRSRRDEGNSLQAEDPEYQTATRKRSQVDTQPTATPAMKRSKVKERRAPSNVLSLCGAEFEEEEEEKAADMERSYGSGHSSEERPATPVPPINTSGRGTKTMTPPILIDEAEMERKRDESLNALKAVFSSSSDETKVDPARRKLPIFCATGAKPHLPSPLSSTHTVTQEDLEKDREATAARLKAFLEAEDEIDSPKSLNMPIASNVVTSTATRPEESVSVSRGSLPQVALSGVSKSEVAGASLSSLKTLNASVPVSLPTLATTAAVPKSTSAKTVSFAPLPTLNTLSALPSPASLAPTAGGSPTTNTGGIPSNGGVPLQIPTLVKSQPLTSKAPPTSLGSTTLTLGNQAPPTTGKEAPPTTFGTQQVGIQPASQQQPLLNTSTPAVLPTLPTFNLSTGGGVAVTTAPSTGAPLTLTLSQQAKPTTATFSFKLPQPTATQDTPGLNLKAPSSAQPASSAALPPIVGVAGLAGAKLPPMAGAKLVQPQQQASLFGGQSSALTQPSTVQKPSIFSIGQTSAAQQPVASSQPAKTSIFAGLNTSQPNSSAQLQLPSVSVSSKPATGSFFGPSTGPSLFYTPGEVPAQPPLIPVSTQPAQSTGGPAPSLNTNLMSVKFGGQGANAGASGTQNTGGGIKFNFGTQGASTTQNMAGNTSAGSAPAGFNFSAQGVNAGSQNAAAKPGFNFGGASAAGTQNAAGNAQTGFNFSAQGANAGSQNAAGNAKTGFNFAAGQNTAGNNQFNFGAQGANAGSQNVQRTAQTGFNFGAQGINQNAPATGLNFGGQGPSAAGTAQTSQFNFSAQGANAGSQKTAGSTQTGFNFGAQAAGNAPTAQFNFGGGSGLTIGGGGGGAGAPKVPGGIGGNLFNRSNTGQQQQQQSALTLPSNQNLFATGQSLFGKGANPPAGQSGSAGVTGGGVGGGVSGGLFGSVGGGIQQQSMFQFGSGGGQGTAGPQQQPNANMFGLNPSNALNQTPLKVQPQAGAGNIFATNSPSLDSGRKVARGRRRKK